MKKLAFAVLTAGFVAVLAPSAQAVVVYDLTTAGSSITVNNAVFTTVDQSSTGTGVIDSFVRVQQSGTEQGYNTDGRPLQFNENSSPNFTRSLLLSNVPVLTIDGTLYREFLLDINQTGDNPLISLDQVQLFVNTVGDLKNATLSGTNLSGLGTEIYNLDSGGDIGIKLDYSLNSGSGSGDLFLYIPDSLFPTNIAADAQYVYLYSHFGSNFATNDGFEEWAVEKVANPPCEQTRTCGPPPPPPPTIPEPSSLLLLGLGAVGAAGLRRKRA